VVAGTERAHPATDRGSQESCFLQVPGHWPPSCPGPSCTKTNSEKLALARAIEQLYGVPPSAFTRERNAKATALRKAGQPAQAHAVSQLRRPSAPLWATNQLAHEDPKRLVGFIDSAERVRRTQLLDPRAAGEALQRQRTELDALVATSATHRRISDTLLGAAVDRHRAQELREGRLTQELSAPGFEVLAGAPSGRDLSLVPGDQAQRGQRARSREAKRRAQAVQERERRDREAEELERAAAVRQSAAVEAAREAEELARKLTAVRARVRETQRASKAAAAAARKARRGPRR
jgi:hypothetical protein